MSGGGLALTGLVYVFDMFAGFVFISVTCCCVHVLFVWSARPTKLYLKNIEFKMFTCNKKKRKSRDRRVLIFRNYFSRYAHTEQFCFLLSVNLDFIILPLLFTLPASVERPCHQTSSKTRKFDVFTCREMQNG